MSLAHVQWDPLSTQASVPLLPAPHPSASSRLSNGALRPSPCFPQGWSLLWGRWGCSGAWGT